MYHLLHVVIPNVCEESPTRQRFFLPAVVRMTFTKAHSPYWLVLLPRNPCGATLPQNLSITKLCFVIPNVCEESTTRPRFFLPAVVRMTFTKVHSPIILTPPLSAELTILARFASSQPVRCDIAALRTTIAAKLTDN